MLAFGVDIPLIEIILVFAIIMFILLVEALVIISLLVKQMNQNKNLSQLLQNLSVTLLEIKKKEIEELDKLRIRKR